MDEAPSSSEPSKVDAWMRQEMAGADGGESDLNPSEADGAPPEHDAADGPPSEIDAASLPPELDGGMDTALADAEFVDEQANLPDAERADADAEILDALDGSKDSSSTPPCSEQDALRWGERHKSGDLRALITGCGISCDGGVACAHDCARDASAVETCSQCTQLEVACIATWCVNACGPASTESECLSCICGADCVAAFEQCHGRTLAVCPRSRVGISNDAGAHPGPSLGLLFTRSSTGLTTSAQVDRASCDMIADRHVGFLPAGQRRFLSVSMPEDEVVFVYSASCAAPPCETHAYTLSETGTFDARVLETRWDADFSDMETFSLRGARYLLRVRGDIATPNRDTADDLLIDRIEWENDDGLRRLRTLPVSRTKLLTPINQRYTQAEVLAIADNLFLFVHSPVTGEHRFLRIQQAEQGLELVPASPALAWSSGWDLVETFKSFGTWYLFAFKTGRLQARGESAGSIRIWRPTLDAQRQVEFRVLAYDNNWGSPGLDHLAAFTGVHDEANLVLYGSPQGLVVFARLAQDPTLWPSQSFGIDMAVRFYNRPPVPPWDTMEAYGHGQW